MGIKVLIVDDSTFFRKRLTEIIKGDPGLEVVGEAKDGKEGVEKTLSLRPDVITMDVEMPVMDGITAVKKIMSKCPTPILMFSSLTFEGANSTFKALEAGAVDFMPKNFDDIAHKREDALNALRSSIKAVARSRIRRITPSSSSSSFSSSASSSSLSSSPASSLGSSSFSRPSTFSSTSTATSATSSSAFGRTSSLTHSSTSTISRPGLGSAASAPRAGTLNRMTQTNNMARSSFGLNSGGVSSRTHAQMDASSLVSASSAPSAGTAIGSSARSGLDKICETLSGVNQGRPAAAMQFSFGNARGVSTNFKVSGKSHDIIAIGSSTGGPIALQNIIPKLPKLNVPLVIVQHMPASFTATFAQRLDNLSPNTVVEAQEGMFLEPGHCYIAPGGRQMIFEKAGGKTKVRILPADSRIVYHPCVDVSFASIASIYGGSVLAMILTGMGSDGCEGCRLLKKAGSVIWAQNEDTCVVYGMPQAVVNSGLADQILPLDKFADCITQEMRM